MTRFLFATMPAAGHVGLLVRDAQRRQRAVRARPRNRVLNAAIYQTLYRSLDRDYHAMRRSLGMEAAEGGLFDETLSPYLYLQPTVPSFEYPRSDLAPQVHFVGPLLPPVPAGFTAPAWWDEMTADPRPVVLVTQGTVATDPGDLLLPALDALVTNGGYGGLHFALAHGVPLVVAGATEEKPELVARVNWSGVGIGMRTQRPGRRQLRDAVRKLPAEPDHAARAAPCRRRCAATTAGTGPSTCSSSSPPRARRCSARRAPPCPPEARLRAARRQPRGPCRASRPEGGIRSGAGERTPPVAPAPLSGVTRRAAVCAASRAASAARRPP